MTIVKTLTGAVIVVAAVFVAALLSGWFLGSPAATAALALLFATAFCLGSYRRNARVQPPT
ncbi:MAG: hypothetical protein QOJ92_2117 [Frankiales bacterium]|nr:hypothetical protein [Frankiales bacterium]